MRTMIRIAPLLACMLLAVALGGIEARHEFSQPRFNPAPWVSAFSPDRQTVMESIVEQGYLEDWYNSYRFSAEYDMQGRISAQKGFAWIEDTESWLHNYTVSAVYRPDNRLQRADLSVLVDGEWQDYGVVDYLYDNNLLRSIRFDRYTEQGREPWWQAAYYYLPSTLLLDKVVEIYYFNSPAPGSMKKYEYIWDAGSRPAQITESVMSDMSEWVTQTRYTYMYHNDDQTTHAGYLRMLQYGWVFNNRLVSGIQPTMLLESRRFDQAYSSNTWIELYRNFYIYDTDNRLLSIDTYEQASPNLWDVNYQQTFSYESGMPVIETWWQDSSGQNQLTPNARFLYSYTQLTATDDPVASPVVSNLKVYPNPFNPLTGISYKLQSPAHTEVSVYNLKGQKVRTLHRGSNAIGEHRLSWDGRDEQGRELSAGIFLIRLEAGKQSSTVKAVLAK